jgi:hypothetical protein
VAKKTFGIPGTAVVLGMGGLYLVYIGLKDVAPVEGLRSLLRKERPTPRPRPTTTPTGTAPQGSGGDQGIDRLVGFAALHYPAFKAQFGLTIFGYGLRDSPSDHTLGKALDLMHPTPQQAQAIIARFQVLPGAKYWIWNREIAEQDEGWRKKRYTRENPHTDHVHLSFY